MNSFVYGVFSRLDPLEKREEQGGEEVVTYNQFLTIGSS